MARASRWPAAGRSSLQPPAIVCGRWLGPRAAALPAHQCSSTHKPLLPPAAYPVAAASTAAAAGALRAMRYASSNDDTLLLLGGAAESKVSVTGPSFSSETRIMAPKTPSCGPAGGRRRLVMGRLLQACWQAVKGMWAGCDEPR